ncbi:MAG: transporter, partial [Saprospiraceae bacterium]
MMLMKYLLLGMFFGFVIIKAEVVSWFRIQEMFRFQSFHMYGIIMTAIAVGMTSILLIKKMKAKTINGEEIKIEPKKFSWGIVIGGFI